MNPDPESLSIAAVERDTRIPKDTLRVWERRYGFPAPGRDGMGERLYPADQVRRLRLIKRLLDAGLRPGHVVGQSDEDLRVLASSVHPRQKDHTDATAEVARLLQTIRRHDAPALRRQLNQALLKVGLGSFVTTLAVPLCIAVGDAWARGELEVFEEHLCSEALAGALRAALAQGGDSVDVRSPRVLLSTLPSEVHTLGLLMAEALLTLEGCACTNLGAQTPQHDLVRAANAHRAQVVAVSFTAAANVHQAVKGLAELRAALPSGIALWVGTPLLAIGRRAAPRIQVFHDFVSIGPEVERWRQAMPHPKASE